MKNLIKILEEAEKLIPDILNEVESEYKMGGLSIGLYADYATDVSKRHNRQTILKLVDGIDKWKELNKTDGENTTFSDRNLTYHDGFNACLNKLGSLLQPLKDKLKQ